MRLVTDERDGALTVEVADALAGRVAGKPAAYDQIGRLHVVLRLLPQLDLRFTLRRQGLAL
jgi:hypothetical protein